MRSILLPTAAEPAIDDEAVALLKEIGRELAALASVAVFVGAVSVFAVLLTAQHQGVAL